MEKENDNITRALGRWTQHNINFVKRFNKDASSNLVGIKWHVDDVFMPQDLRDIDSLIELHTIGRAKVQFASGGGYDTAGKLSDPFNMPLHQAASNPDKFKEIQAIKDNVAKQLDALSKRTNMTPDEKSIAKLAIDDAARKQAQPIADSIVLNVDGLDKSYEIYANRMSKAFMDKKERQALRIIAQSRFTDPNSTFFQGLETGLRTFDALTNFMKANMLGFSATWLKTNYWDNMMKAYAETGLVTAVKTALFSADSKIARDIWGLSNSRVNKFLSSELDDALKRGVLENPLFEILKNNDDDVLNFMRGGSDFTAQAKRAGGGDLLKGFNTISEKVFKPWQNFLAKTTFRVGSTMEGTARMTTYLDTIQIMKQSGVDDMIRKSLTDSGIKVTKDAIENRIKDMAADVTSRTFFDYQKISQFERAFLRRLIPFYSFYSKNLPYWVELSANIEKIGRLSDLDKFRRNLGRPLTETERAGATEYFKQNAGRIVGQGPKGKRGTIFPTNSSYDAFQMLSGRTLIKQIEEKLNPLIKTPLEIAYDRDWFTGGFFRPSSARTPNEKRLDRPGKKYLFSRGFKLNMVQKMIDKIPGVNPQSLGIEIDKNGNPIATEDNIVLAEKIFGTLWPMGAVDQAVGAFGKAEQGTEEGIDRAINFLTPVKTVQISPASEKFRRQQRERSRKPLE